VAPDAVCAAADARLRAVVPAADALVGLDHAAKRAIELGVSAARGELGADFYGTQHLLLGMMRESADEATRALAELGVTREMVLRQARTVRVETSRHG
jgi:ATP-dependent Clp protease ATP-binding subunit ClpA